MRDPVNQNASSLCWQCRNAYGLCAWSRDGLPVNGWTAVRRDLPPAGKNGSPIKSFFVLRCPRFSPDPRFTTAAGLPRPEVSSL